MPNLNHSGPEGHGPKTGRKLGQCKKTDEEINKSENLERVKGNDIIQKTIADKARVNV